MAIMYGCIDVDEVRHSLLTADEIPPDGEVAIVFGDGTNCNKLVTGCIDWATGKVNVEVSASMKMEVNSTCAHLILTTCAEACPYPTCGAYVSFTAGVDYQASFDIRYKCFGGTDKDTTGCGTPDPPGAPPWGPGVTLTLSPTGDSELFKYWHRPHRGHYSTTFRPNSSNMGYFRFCFNSSYEKNDVIVVDKVSLINVGTGEELLNNSGFDIAGCSYNIVAAEYWAKTNGVCGGRTSRLSPWSAEGCINWGTGLFEVEVGANYY